MKEPINECYVRGENMTFKDEMTFQNYIYDVSDNGRIIAALKSLPLKPFASKVLCLWGGNSSGKTHLLHAIQKACRSARVKYITADQFCINLACGIADNKVRKFEDSFNEVDILLLDDAQFLVGKYALEFLKERIISRIHCNVLLASDCDPYATGILKNNEIVLRLISPNSIVRLQVVRQKSSELQLQIDESVQQLIATNITDVRRITGFLTFLKATKESMPICP